MGNNQNISLREIIEKGLEIMYTRLLERAIKENDELVTRDENGKVVRIKASQLKARLK